MRHGIIIVNMPVTGPDCFVGSRQSDRAETSILCKYPLTSASLALLANRWRYAYIVARIHNFFITLFRVIST